MIRRIAVAAALALGVTAAGVGAGQATAAQPLVGPECRPDVVSSVLDSLARNGVPVIPGQQIQYLQVSQAPSGQFFLELCVVTVPAD